MYKTKSGYRSVSLFLILCFAVTWESLIHTFTAAIAAENSQAPSLYPPFLGEDLSYNISFWLFKNAASARMTFFKTEQGYEATVEAQTGGIVGFLTRHMHETMKSIMRFDQNKRRFQPLLFQEVLRQGDKERIKTVEFNYDKKIILVTYEGTGRKKAVIKKRLPKDDVDDLLSAFYNLRFGYFGEIKQGKNIIMKVWVKETPSKITVALPERYEKPDGKACEGKYFAMLSMDKNITNIASRKLIGWLAEDFTPLCGTVEDAYLLGDLKVRLKEKK
jgi:hypothetical protein